MNILTKIVHAVLGCTWVKNTYDVKLIDGYDDEIKLTCCVCHKTETFIGCSTVWHSLERARRPGTLTESWLADAWDSARFRAKRRAKRPPADPLDDEQ